MDDALAVLKFAGLLLSGVFGVFGLLVKFKDANDQVTRAGKIALLLIVASSLVSIISAVLELHRESAKERTALSEKATAAMEASQRSERLLHSIARTLYPIDTLSASYSIAAPMTHPEIGPYLERFSSEVPRVVETYERTRSLPSVFGSAFSYKDRLASFEFYSKNRLAPDVDRELLAHTVLSSTNIELLFFARPQSNTSASFQSISLASPPDLKVTLLTLLGSSSGDGGHVVDYEIQNQEFSLKANRVGSDPTLWSSSGSITSIYDLVGAQLVVRVPWMMVSGDAKVDKQARAIRGSFRLRWIDLHFGKGLQLSISSDNLKPLAPSDGVPTYLYQFPGTFDELFKAKR